MALAVENDQASRLAVVRVNPFFLRHFGRGCIARGKHSVHWVCGCAIEVIWVSGGGGQTFFSSGSHS